MKRREFIKSTSAATGALAAAPYVLAGEGWKGANDRVNVAVVGIHGMGQYHTTAFHELDNVRVAALCDVDESLFEERVQKLYRDPGLPEPKTYTDLRRLYEDKDIDAVSIVTPNHWHTLAALWAAQAGKHVTVEKPCCHTFHEGQKLVEAAARYDVVIQDGAEQRSNPCAQTLRSFLEAGGLGDVYLARGLCYKWRDTIGRTPDESVPPGVHYDLWMGPAPERPFSKNRFHYNWHWQWDYGNGDIGNQGVHEVDMARYGLGVGLPTRVSALGGHFMFDDDQETPNTLTATFEFDETPRGGTRKMMQFEVRHWITDRGGFDLRAEQEGHDYMTSTANTIGNLYYGSKGFVVKNVDQWQAFMGKEKEPGESGRGLGNHFQNFVDAIRAGDKTMVTSTAEDGFQSCALIHLANISYRLGRTIDFDPVAMKVIGDNEAQRMLTKEYRAPYTLPEKV
jgi:predicted dehydrogenase